MSIHCIKTKGKPAPAKEAPIIVCAPHSSFFDPLAVAITRASYIGNEESKKMPIFGSKFYFANNYNLTLNECTFCFLGIIQLAQPIFVDRADPVSRTKTIQDILDRVNSTEKWPQIFLFPEGAATNGKSLIRFKPGAFYPGQKVQPVLIRYPNKVDLTTLTRRTPNHALLFWRILTQINTSVEFEYLPVYTPSEKEIEDPKLYARNVENLMAE